LTYPVGTGGCPVKPSMIITSFDLAKALLYIEKNRRSKKVITEKELKTLNKAFTNKSFP
jgi:hypothetical protein